MPTRIFKLIRGEKNTARRGIITTAHGVIDTPVFMPIGTQGPVKTTSPDEMEDLGADIILNNTYHLYLRPGVEIIEKAGGLHRFTGWEKPILTDSGGFQFYSLGALKKVRDDGIEFQSHLDGSRHFFTPEKVIEIQTTFGSDVMMPLDVCVPSPAEYLQAKHAGHLTFDWLKQSADRFNAIASNSDQSLFGIVQGATFSDLRAENARMIIELNLPGYSIGGLAVGEDKELMWEMIAVINEILPADKPRYLMGVGTPADIVRAVALGIDMFDCVMPTRNARNGTVFTHSGRIVLKGASFSADYEPIENECQCYSCAKFSRAYVRHLLNVNEILGLRLTTIHNLHFYLSLMRDIQNAIMTGQFQQFKNGFLEKFESGEDPET